MKKTATATAPGPHSRFYVALSDPDGKTALLSGPYGSRRTALDMVSRAERLAEKAGILPPGFEVTTVLSYSRTPGALQLVGWDLTLRRHDP